MIWINQIVQGILLGGYYAVIACRHSFMFGVMRIINLAHGSLAIVAALLLLLPGGLWGWLEDRFGLRLLPVGYRVAGQSAGEP